MMNQFFDLIPWLAFVTIIVIYLVVFKALVLNPGVNNTLLKSNSFIAVVGILSVGISVIVAVLSGVGLIDFISPDQSIAIGTGIAGLIILLAVVVNRWSFKIDGKI